MTRSSKIVYLFISVLFFILFNGFLTDIIIQNGYRLAENPVLQVLYVENIGAAFNIFEGYRVFLILFAATAMSVILFFTIKQIKRIPVFGLFFVSLLLAGIFNNMLERIMFGFVRDFIKLKFVDFPVFNISDLFINIAVIGIVFIILKYGYFKK